MEKKYFDIAAEYAKKSYSPYSRYRVSAILISKQKDAFIGVNIENASYSMTMCAERTALFKAVSEGVKTFSEILVYAEGENLPYPCGACLQTLSEFADEDFIITLSNGIKTESHLFKDFLPMRFKL